MKPVVFISICSLMVPLSVGQTQRQAPPAQTLADPAQTATPPSADQREPPLEGIWPTERMIESMVRRWALEAAETYELDDRQYRQMESRMLERSTRFLRENRRDMQPLVNEFFEARLGVEPPTPRQVRDWATRALPVFDRIQAEIEATHGDIRPLLRPEQRIRFEAEALKMKLGLGAMGRQIAQWQKGEYALSDWWDPPPRRERRPTTQPMLARDGIEVPDQITMELDAWDQYVADFIEKHRLDDAQRMAALSFLKDVKERARAHQERHRDELIDLERRIASPQGKKADDVASQLERLYGPVDALFGELEERLRRLPTQQQRQAATQPAQ